MRTVGIVIAVVSMGVAAWGSRQAAAVGNDLHASMTIIAPAAAGGGWDGVAREMQQAMKANDEHVRLRKEIRMIRRRLIRSERAVYAKAIPGSK